MVDNLINLENTMILKTNLKGANLEKARLANSFINESDLSEAILSGADLTGARVINTILDQASLQNANLDRITIAAEMMMTKDHILPRSKGGANRLENYQPMCSKCNCKKGDRIEK